MSSDLFVMIVIDRVPLSLIRVIMYSAVEVFVFSVLGSVDTKRDRTCAPQYYRDPPGQKLSCMCMGYVLKINLRSFSYAESM